MGISPKDVRISPEAKEGPVTDALVARGLIETGFPIRQGRNITAALSDCFAALEKHEKALPEAVREDRPRSWTKRRVEAIWGKEARRIDHYEIQDLTAVAVEEARHERQRLQAREERLAAFIAAHRSGDRQSVDQRLGRMAGRLDHTGAGRTETDADFDQSNGWGR